MIIVGLKVEFSSFGLVFLVSKVSKSLMYCNKVKEYGDNFF